MAHEADAHAICFLIAGWQLDCLLWRSDDPIMGPHESDGGEWSRHVPSNDLGQTLYSSTSPIHPQREQAQTCGIIRIDFQDQRSVCYQKCKVALSHSMMKDGSQDLVHDHDGHFLQIGLCKYASFPPVFGAGGQCGYPNFCPNFVLCLVFV